MNPTHDVNSQCHTAQHAISTHHSQHLATFALFVATLAFGAAAPSAYASCWQEPEVAQLAKQIAQMSFPDVAQQMPRVIICDARHFAQNISGDFNPGTWLIRLSTGGDRNQLQSVLAHELGHAATSLRGTDDGRHAGHGAGWFVTMLEAGYVDEARRVGTLDNIYPGIGETLALAMSRVVNPATSTRPDNDYAGRRDENDDNFVEKVSYGQRRHGRRWKHRCHYEVTGTERRLDQFGRLLSETQFISPVCP